jgi:hypothetical protein
MKNISTGFGLCVLGLGIAAWPILDRLAPSANASAFTAAASAVSTAATAQTGPTIVWYGTASSGVAMRGTNTIVGRSDGFWMLRAWSDGRVEARWVKAYDGSSQGINTPLNSCEGDGWNGQPCVGPWVVISDANQGYNAASDINFDAKVDGADLGQLLSDWGDAPRQDIPPSDCPLALINP